MIIAKEKEAEFFKKIGGKIVVQCDCVVNNDKLFRLKKGGTDNSVNSDVRKYTLLMSLRIRINGSALSAEAHC